MSVINKMLQDLDRRNAIAGAEAGRLAQPVKPVGGSRDGHEWFWRVVAALLLAAVAWVGWVAYQLQPRPLATEQAFRAAEQARRSAIRVAAQAAEPPTVEPPTVELPQVEVPKVESVAEPPATFKLARALETPIAARPAPPPPPLPAAEKPKAKPPAAKAPEKAKSRVDKRAHARSAHDVAEGHFRRAAELLNQGRVSEAEAALREALKADPAHTAARQAQVALLLEQGRMPEAQATLGEALAANPAQPAFALAAARIHVENRDYPAALEVLERAGGAAAGSELEAMRAVVLQREGRHAEAAGAFRAALQAGRQEAGTWMGLAISLEALGHRAEAAEAYRRALSGGTLAGEVKQYAEARIKALQ